MPQKFITIADEMLDAMEQAVQECETLEFAEMFRQFRMYQENRLKINKESRESKMAARKEGGGGAKRGASAKMTGVVKLIAVEGAENTFKVEKVSIPVAPKTPEPEPEEEEDISNNPEAIAAAVAEAAAARAASPKQSPKPKSARKPTKKEIREAEERADSKTGRTCDEIKADMLAKKPAPKKKNLKITKKPFGLTDVPAAESDADSDATLTDVE